MTTPDPTGEQPAPTGPTGGWGELPAETPGYAERPAPRYGQYAPQEPSVVPPPPPPPAPAGPGYGQAHYGQPQYGQAQYGQAPAGLPPAIPYGAGPYQMAVKPGIVPLRPLTLGEIFDGAFGAIRRNPRVMLGLPAIVIAVATVAGTFLGYLISGYIIPALPADMASDQTFVDMVSIYTSTLGTSLTLSLASPIVTGLLIGSIGQSILGRTISIGVLWAQVRRRVWALLGFSLLVALAQLIVVALYALAIWGAWSANVGAGALVAIVGGLALTVAAFWFTVRILLVPPALVLEGQGLWKAVGRGWRLSRGSFWRLLGIYLLASIAVGFISSVLATPFSLIGMLTLTADGSPTAAYLAITGLGTILTGVLSASFMAGVVCLLYIDVRMRREGLDVELAAAASDPDQPWDR